MCETRGIGCEGVEGVDTIELEGWVGHLQRYIRLPEKVMGLKTSPLQWPHTVYLEILSLIRAVHT